MSSDVTVLDAAEMPGPADLLGIRRTALADQLERSEFIESLSPRFDLVDTRRQLADAAAVDCDQILDTDLLRAATELEALRRFVDATSMRILGALDERSVTDQGTGMHTGPWLASESALSTRDTRARVRLAAQLRTQLPDVLTALSDGHIGDQHARVLAMAAANPRITEQFIALVPELIDNACSTPFDAWRREVMALVALLDQDGPEPDDDPDDANVVSMARGLGGSWTLRGHFDAVTGAVVHEALTKKADKLFHARNRDEDLTVDLRAPGRRQLMARGLYDIARESLASPVAGRAPAAEIVLHLNAADATDLRDGDGVPIGDTGRRTLMCDPLLRGVVFGMHRTVLDVARINRLATPAQRVAMTARDGGCLFPGCDSPPSWCDAHHVLHWEDGGPTTLDNLASLCRHHHGVSHRDGWSMGVTDDEWFWWITPSGQQLWSQRHGIPRDGP